METTSKLGSLSTAAQQISDAVDGHEADLRVINSKIHSNPETCYEEFQAHDVIVDFLEKRGFGVSKKAFGLQTAFLAEYGQGGRIVTFCAEYDALPQIGHGCGHNLIAVSSIAAFLGTVAAMKESSSSGRVQLLGCPAEEGGGGKLKLIEAGAFSNVDAALMIHPTPPVDHSRPEIAGISYGTCLSACGVNATFIGKPSHAAATPWEGINALDAATLSYTAIGLLRQHIRPSDRINVIMPEGGTAHNVIPERSRIRCNVRSETAAQMNALKARVENCFKGAATATGCTMELSVAMAPYMDIRPNEGLCTEFADAMRKWERNFVCNLEDKVLSAFSTDMGNVTYEVPSFHGNFSIPTAPGVGLHTEEFRDAAGTLEAHRVAMGVGKGMAATGLRVLNDDEFASLVKRNFEADRKLR
ncbi:hypothetical protein N7533_013617 [Penicillium manginii]|uniref:uncharacterized protein n=1 Tax=Penicillium manginii TaxID=203109 RepID=UPI002547FADF|nr:uncharacterized protein N7533_013617 [Penicillium manginii]KAJ5733170.1 hypothetical protein N7533_013617 [Penicillium manginii]